MEEAKLTYKYCNLGWNVEWILLIHGTITVIRLKKRKVENWRDKNIKIYILKKIEDDRFIKKNIIYSGDIRVV